MIPFSEAIQGEGILLFDGATGTRLAARGAPQGPVANLEHGGIVKSVHLDYKNAGADIILTNTLTANRIFLEHAGQADRFADINTLGAQLARDAAGQDCYVLGDMCSTGQFLEPLGDYTEQQFYDNFLEQARILVENGVDGIIIETMTDVREAAIAVRAAREASGLPVLASVAFDPVADGFRTMMGDTVEKATAALIAAGAAAVGSNCGTIDPVEMSRLITQVRTFSDAKLVAEPNAGKPELAGAKVFFNLSPEDFADGVVKCIEAGAALVGGCCGTTPAHIEALARRVK